MITRFDPTPEFDGWNYCAGATMEEDLHGDFVQWEDYQALANKYNSLKEAFEQIQEIMGDYSFTHAMMEE